MTKRRFSPRRIRAAALALALAILAGLAWPALAAVTLTTFEAIAQPDNTIRVYWAAATELDTASYNLYRSDNPSPPTGWGTPVVQKVAGGSVAPAEYEYIDPSVTPGVTYYYLLEDISTSGQKGTHGPKSARVMLAGETPTNTPTATATATKVPTATTGPGSGGVGATATPTLPPPTATRQYTNTPVGAAAGTPVVSAPTRQPTLVVAGRATPTRLAGAALATPTGQPQAMPTAPVIAEQPTVAPIQQQPELPTATVAVIAQAPAAGEETATAVPTREVTPIVFASETQEVGATDGSAQAVAAQGSRNVNGALAFGGAALGLAGVLAAVYLFFRSRKV